MYQVVEDRIAITKGDWLAAGLTEDQLWKDSRDGHLSIIRRGINHNTIIDARSIKRRDRIEAIEALKGKIGGEAEERSVFSFEADLNARRFFLAQTKPDGTPLPAERIEEYVNRASIFEAIRRGLERHTAARASRNKRMDRGRFWEVAAQWAEEMSGRYRFKAPGNARALERAFKRYVNDGYRAFIHKNFCNDAARLVSAKMEKLLLRLWISKNKPFVKEVHELYIDFVRGNKNFVDTETGEVFKPNDYCYIPKDGGEPRPIEISVATVWNYLRDHVNDAATASRRDGNYVSVVEKRPFHFWKSPVCSLSKISMDDADLSCKLKGGGRVHRYMAVDVASGYWFTPVYSKDALTADDVMQCYRNMFCELEIMGLPMPGEIEHEHHLMDSIMTEGFRTLFPFTTVSSHSRNKRAEHGIRSLKWGVSHRNGNVNGRFFGKGSYRGIRFKEKGDFKEKEFEYDRLVDDDLHDIEQHNKGLHPKQKTYPGMSREDVFLNNINRALPPLDPWYLYRYIGNETETSIRNNNHLRVNYEEYLIDDFKMLKRLKPGCTEVLAYWIPKKDGSVDKVYIYQEEKYIGSATGASQYRYNESKFEETGEDHDKRLKQDKRLAKFDRLMRETMNEVPRKMIVEQAAVSEAIASVEVEVVPPPLPPPSEEFDEVMNRDWGAYGAESL